MGIFWKGQIVNNFGFWATQFLLLLLNSYSVKTAIDDM